MKAAQEDISRRQITAALDGVIEKVYRRKGEWVQPGEPVVKVMRVDSLWIEAFIDATLYTPGMLRGKTVDVTVGLPGRQVKLEGKIVFASEDVQPGPQFLVKAEIQNSQDARGDWLLRPGLTADMMIQMQ